MLPPTPLSMLLILTLSSVSHATSKAVPVFSANRTWIENLAVRRSNGHILLATATSAVLYEVDPVSHQREVVYDFREYGNAIMSIADVGPDLFLVNTMDCNIYKLACTPGTGVTWRVDLRKSHQPQRTDQDVDSKPKAARVKQLAKGPGPNSLLNGAAALNERVVLLVDQALGGIWAINIHRGRPRLVIADPSMNNTSSQGGGVNGIRVQGRTLYFNNPSQGILARVSVSPRTGRRRDPVQVIKAGLSPDDFEVDEQTGLAYVTEGDRDRLVWISLGDGRLETVVGGLHGPTTARWKDVGKSLYVATTGGYAQWLSGNPKRPAAVYEVNVE